MDPPKIHQEFVDPPKIQLTHQICKLFLTTHQIKKLFSKDPPNMQFSLPIYIYLARILGASLLEYFKQDFS
jgi:hypothetical protein